MNSKFYEPAVYYNTFTKLFSLYGIHDGPEDIADQKGGLCYKK